MGHPLARNGAALAPFRANGAHPSYCDNDLCVRYCACVRTNRQTRTNIINFSALMDTKPDFREGHFPCAGDQTDFILRSARSP